MKKPQILVWALVVLALHVFIPSMSAQSSGATGTEAVPGMTNVSVDYDAKVTPRDDNSVEVEITFTNKGKMPITFLVCAMVQTILDEVAHPNWEIFLNKSHGRPWFWDCQKTSDATRHASFHFGCHLVTVPANDKITTKWTSKPMPLPAKSLMPDDHGSKLKSIYMDFLQAGDWGNPPNHNNETWAVDPKCDAAVAQGYNVNISPKFPGPDAGVRWVGTFSHIGFCGEKLVLLSNHKECAMARFETGNYVTMNVAGKYPGVVNAKLTGVPPGTDVEFRVPGQFDSLQTAPQEGTLVLRQRLEMSPMIMDDMFLGVALDGRMAEGARMRLEGEVTGTPETPFYGAKPMYHFTMDYVHDTTPPIIESTTFTRVGNSGRASVTARDATTRVATASVVLRGNETLPAFVVLERSPADPDTFSGTIILPPGTTAYRFRITDAAGNVGESAWLLPEPTTAMLSVKKVIVAVIVSLVVLLVAYSLLKRRTGNNRV
jgi:hypothetical protein